MSFLCFPSQFDPVLQTPLILDESLDLSDSEESQFIGAFSDGLWAKSEPILSMSAFQKPAAGAILGRSRLSHSDRHAKTRPQITVPRDLCMMLVHTRLTGNPHM